ncbi:MAG: hypothetical protein IKD89_04855 [Clostridia bacterium]|nr:hypothetical protein [Clostridia bacterium]
MENNEKFKIDICSFGYKYGGAGEVNLLFDVRLMPNPYYDESLRPLCGTDEPIRAFMAAHEECGAFYDNMARFAFYYIEESRRAKRNVTVAFGCTGGRHRSVYFAQRFFDECVRRGYDARVVHRELGRET